MNHPYRSSSRRVSVRLFSQWIAIYCLALLALVFSPCCRAQLSTAGTITGTVVDQTGAIIPNATVIITDTDTNVTTKVVSNSAGLFIQVGLPSGHYSVKVASAGFTAYERTGIFLEPAATMTVNASLNPGASTQTVTVAANAAAVNTVTPEVSSTVSSEDAQELPLNGRNYEGLVQLMPGVINSSPDTAMGPGGFATSNYVNINGSGSSGTFYTLDGIWNENTGNMTQTTITPVPEEIEEIKVLQNNYDVKYSLMGAGVMMVQTKSGGSNFHGGAWEYLRNTIFDTRNFFDPASSGVPAEEWNTYGWHLGGPVFIPHHYNVNKQRTFFYWNQQWIKEKNASVATGQTPLASMRGIGNTGADAGYAVFPGPGALYGTAYLKNPSAAGSCNATSQAGCFSQDGNGNWLVPMSMVNPSQLALLNALAPLPNYSSGATNYVNTNPNVTNQLDQEAKVDHYISPKFRLTGELFWESQNAYNANAARMGSPYSTNYDVFLSDNKLAQVSLTQMYTPTMTNTTSFAMNNYNITHTFGGILNVDQVQGYNEQLPYSGGYLENYVPHITFGSGGWSQFGSSANNIIPAATDLENTISDDWTWQRGKHLIEAGGELVFGAKRQWSTVQNTTGDAAFDGYATGNAVADYLLGMPNSFDQGNGAVRKYNQYTIFTPYVEDQYSAARGLKITVGVRTFRMPFPSSQAGYSANFNPALFNATTVPTVSDGGTLSGTYAANYANGIEVDGENGVPLNITNQHNFYIAPMAGFAWDVFGDGKTSLRGGFGYAYNRNGGMGAACSQGCVSYPVLSQTVLTDPTFPNVTGGTAPTPTAGSITGMPHDYQVAMVKTWSLTLEQQLPGNWMFRLAGVGDIANHLSTSYNLNQPAPTTVNGVPYNFNPNLNTSGYSSSYYAPYQGWGTITWNNPIGIDNWTALEVSVKHPVGHNFNFTLAYTWSHNLDNAGGFENPYNLHAAYGNSSLDTPQVLTFSGIFTEPWFKTGWEKPVLGGWKYSDMTTLQSGSYTTFGISGSNLGPITQPNMVAPITYTKNSWKPYQNGANAAWFTPGTGAGTATGSIFQRPANGFYGTAGDGNELGPGTEVSNMALYKDFPVHENVGLEFRAEYFNVFNHTNPNGPNVTAGNAAFGQISTAKDPRIGQMSLKVSF
jgi:Carboxypeptidase regulatory-like domain/TonB-dependent Receptor Plug Domain